MRIAVGLWTEGNPSQLAPVQQIPPVKNSSAPLYLNGVQEVASSNLAAPTI